MHWLISTSLIVNGLYVVSAAYTRTDDKNELQNTINCKSVCGDCHCRGFYCGEECICECDSDNDEDIKCLMTMHNKCKKLKFPFEVLIQGPSGNRFMRSAMLFEELYQTCLKGDMRNKRNTISLYRPENRRIKRQIDEVAEKIPEVEGEDEAIVGAPQLPPEIPEPEGTIDTEPAQEAAEAPGTNVEAPTVGLPLALALPAVRAQQRLTASTIRVQYEAALARLRARLAARRPLFLGAGAPGADGVPGLTFLKPPNLPLQFTV